MATLDFSRNPLITPVSGNSGRLSTIPKVADLRLRRPSLTTHSWPCCTSPRTRSTPSTSLSSCPSPLASSAPSCHSFRRCWQRSGEQQQRQQLQNQKQCPVDQQYKAVLILLCECVKDGRTRKNFLRTRKIRTITFGEYKCTFKYGKLPLENICERLNTDNLCVGIILTALFYCISRQQTLRSLQDWRVSMYLRITVIIGNYMLAAKYYRGSPILGVCAKNLMKITSSLKNTLTYLLGVDFALQKVLKPEPSFKACVRACAHLY